MKAPRFWYKPPGCTSASLAPFAFLYEKANVLRRYFTTPHVLPKPVICVGNVTLGGAGKTPTVQFLYYTLKGMGMCPAVISKGYKGSIKHTHKVRTWDKPSFTGDEPLLLAKNGIPTWVGSKRVQSAQAAIHTGADSIIMDDGFQNPQLHKHVNILVVDGTQGFGNERVFPSGPLREPVKHALARTHAVILIHKTPAVETYMKHQCNLTGIPLFCAHFQPQFPAMQKETLFDAHFQGAQSVQNDLVASYQGHPTTALFPMPPAKVLACAGLGHPEKFRIYLHSLGYDVVKFYPFEDHRAYTEKDLMYLRQESQKHQLPFLTTEKDIIKMQLTNTDNIFPLRIALTLENSSLFEQWLKETLEQAFKT